MKKTIKIFAMAIVVAMLCTMLPVSTFATADEYAGATLYTGEYYTLTPEIDGVVDEGYACITPNGADIVFTDECFWYGDVASRTPINEAEVLPEQQEFADSITTNFYIAQDETNVYIAVEQSMSAVPYTVNGVTYRADGNILNVLRVGFNPDDWTQQISMYSHGQYVTQDGPKTEMGITYNSTWTRYPFLVLGLADADTFTDKQTDATDIIANYVDNDGLAKDSVMTRPGGMSEGTLTRTYEVKLNKAAIAAEYEAVFGAEVSFDSMYIGMSSADYRWANDADNSSLVWFAGTVAESTYLPYAVEFAPAPETEPEETQPEETQPEETEAEETEPEETEAEETEAATTEAPATEAATTAAPATKAPETEAPEAKGGCGASVSVAGIALVAALGACTAFVAKKKED